MHDLFPYFHNLSQGASFLTFDRVEEYLFLLIVLAFHNLGPYLALNTLLLIIIRLLFKRTKDMHIAVFNLVLAVVMTAILAPAVIAPIVFLATLGVELPLLSEWILFMIAPLTVAVAAGLLVKMPAHSDRRKLLTVNAVLLAVTAIIVLGLYAVLKIFY